MNISCLLGFHKWNKEKYQQRCLRKGCKAERELMCTNYPQAFRKPCRWVIFK